MKTEQIFLSPMSTTEGNDSYRKIFRQKEGSDFVTIRLTSHSYGTGSVINAINKSALVRIPRNILGAFLQHNGVNINVDANTLEKEIPTTIEGKLQVQESFSPWYEGQAAKLNPKTKALVTIDGRPVYRNTVLAKTTDPEYLFGDVVEGKFVAGLVAEESGEGATQQATPAQAFAKPEDVPA